MSCFNHIHIRKLIETIVLHCWNTVPVSLHSYTHQKTNRNHCVALLEHSPCLISINIPFARLQHFLNKKLVQDLWAAASPTRTEPPLWIRAEPPDREATFPFHLFPFKISRILIYCSSPALVFGPWFSSTILNAKEALALWSFQVVCFKNVDPAHF